MLHRRRSIAALARPAPRQRHNADVESAWVEREVRWTLDKEKGEKRTVLFPVRIDDAVINTTQQWAYDIRRDRHIGDFRRWKDHDEYQNTFQRLLRDLQAGEAPE